MQLAVQGCKHLLVQCGAAYLRSIRLCRVVHLRAALNIDRTNPKAFLILKSFELACSGRARIRRLLYAGSDLINFGTGGDDFDGLLLLLLLLLRSLTLYQLLNITLQYLIHTGSFTVEHLFLLL